MVESTSLSKVYLCNRVGSDRRIEYLKIYLALQIWWLSLIQYECFFSFLLQKKQPK